MNIYEFQFIQFFSNYFDLIIILYLIIDENFVDNMHVAFTIYVDVILSSVLHVSIKVLLRQRVLKCFRTNCVLFPKMVLSTKWLLNEIVSTNNLKLIRGLNRLKQNNEMFYQNITHFKSNCFLTCERIRCNHNENHENLLYYIHIKGTSSF